MFRESYTTKQVAVTKLASDEKEVSAMRDAIAANKQKQEQLRSEVARLTKEINTIDNTNTVIEVRIKTLVQYHDLELNELINKAFYSYSDKGHDCIVDKEAHKLSIHFYAPESTKERFINLIKKIDKDLFIAIDPKSPKGAVIISTNLKNRDDIIKKLSCYDALQAIIDFENSCETRSFKY